MLLPCNNIQIIFFHLGVYEALVKLQELHWKTF